MARACRFVRRASRRVTKEPADGGSSPGYVPSSRSLVPNVHRSIDKARGRISTEDTFIPTWPGDVASSPPNVASDGSCMRNAFRCAGDELRCVATSSRYGATAPSFSTYALRRVEDGPSEDVKSAGLVPRSPRCVGTASRYVGDVLGLLEHSPGFGANRPGNIETACVRFETSRPFVGRVHGHFESSRGFAATVPQSVVNAPGLLATVLEFDASVLVRAGERLSPPGPGTPWSSGAWTPSMTRRLPATTSAKLLGCTFMPHRRTSGQARWSHGDLRDRRAVERCLVGATGL